MMERTKSRALYEDLCRSIPGGVNSPVRACFAMEQTPLVVKEAHGDQIIDADDHVFIDYCGSWGALIHGHANPQIIAAVYQRLLKGSSFGATTALEGQLATEIISAVDSIEKVRFVSSGTEATMSAVRLARGYTGRHLVVKFSGNYHGHADVFLVQAGSGVIGTKSTPSSCGIPPDAVKHTICLPFNDLNACKQFFSDPFIQSQVAAVILEPIAGNMGVVAASPAFLNYLREVTSQIGAVLIFDEVMCGFRVSHQGAQGLFNIQPDLTCFGKIIGGGFPLAAFGGKTEIMDCLAPLGPVYQAGTLSGNPVAVEAGLQSLLMLKTPGFYEELERKTRLLLDPIDQVIRNEGMNACVQQVGSMFTLFLGIKKVDHFDDALKCDQKTFAKLFRCLFEEGIYIPPSPFEAWFISSQHTDEHLSLTADKVIAFLMSEVARPS